MKKAKIFFQSGFTSLLIFVFIIGLSSNKIYCQDSIKTDTINSKIIKAAEKLYNLNFTEEERKMMVKGLEGNKNQI